jgi:hypothetical protein
MLGAVYFYNQSSRGVPGTASTYTKHSAQAWCRVQVAAVMSLNISDRHSLQELQRLRNNRAHTSLQVRVWVAGSWCASEATAGCCVAPHRHGRLNTELLLKPSEPQPLHTATAVALTYLCCRMPPARPASAVHTQQQTWAPGVAGAPAHHHNRHWRAGTLAGKR